MRVFWGASGTGKSRRAVEEAGDDVYFKPRGKWWDGYQQQQSVILDDFYGWLPFDDLLRLLDRYPLRVEYKGGFHEFNSKTIFITSNVHPLDWYKGDWYQAEQKQALTRRINCIIHFNKLI